MTKEEASKLQQGDRVVYTSIDHPKGLRGIITRINTSSQYVKVKFDFYPDETMFRIQEHSEFLKNLKLVTAKQVHKSTSVQWTILDDNIPENNDGRLTCVFCGAPTKQVQSAMSFMDICTLCKR